ncbi:HhH-GDP family DNA glycosylase [Planctomicrobium piriforme]|uniref:Endonuclease III n=1 Tax=Planctomicrobium piriforme TaxID=1576369 RepID=A0A1I3D3T1_9PLAN|nr:hypothetical protein [Planctomicrobium piriforme]SFH81326.1 hypothetical protein SAMN05421753_10378 [Planctomicrobium piriforme]
MPAKSLKAADKQTILKKLVTEMKRRYGGSIPKQTRSAFDTLLFAACLEDVGHDEAEAAYSRLLDGFFDLNEIRVSSVTEIQHSLGDISDADWKAMRIRESLQHLFEKFYAFDLEFLKRKTQEQAIKELSLIPHQSDFIRGYVVQHALGAHVIPVDGTLQRLLVWLGLAGPDTSCEEAGEELKPGIKKTDAPLLCHLLKCTATDAELIEHFTDGPDEDEASDPFEGPHRLAELFKNPAKKKKKAKPAPVKHAPAKHASAKPAAAKTAAVKAVSHKKPVKKATARPAAPKAVAPTRKVTKKLPAPAKKTNRNRSK